VHVSVIDLLMMQYRLILTICLKNYVVLDDQDMEFLSFEKY